MKVQGMFQVVRMAAVAGMAGVLNAGATTVFFDETFDALALGSLHGQAGWSATNATVQNTVAVSGNAAQIDGGGQATRTGVFGPAASHPQQWFSFDIRMADDIYSFVGQANVDIQHAVHFRGPNANQETFFVYKANTNPSGDVNFSRWELRGIDFIRTSPDAGKDLWYHVILRFDFDLGQVAAEVYQNNVLWWAPLPVTFYNNGNTNFLQVTADSNPAVALYVDNFHNYIPEPASGIVLGLASLLAMRRRRGNGRQ